MTADLTHMLLRCYVAVTTLLVATYLAWPFDDRQWPYLAVTLGAALPAVGYALRRAPAGARLPWWLMLAALTSYNIGNLIWIVLVEVGGRATGDGSLAELFYTGGGLCLLTSAIAVVRLRGAGDIGGVIDSVITAVALGGVLWDAVLLPAMSAQHQSTPRQLSMFLGLTMISGTLGAMLRVSMAGRRSASVWLITASVALVLVADVVSALAVGPDGVRADWTNMVYLAAYAVLGWAALHPSITTWVTPGHRPADEISRGRLTFLGVMLALTPMVGGGRAILGLPTDGILIALSSAALTPLVMIRIARLAAQRRAAEKALHHLATRDALTGLPNRAACLDHLSTATMSAEPLAVLFGDLDGFKPVNDRLGHAAGDELLTLVADRLRACVREGDLVSRFGGDEFVLICRGETAVPGVSERIAAMTALPFVVAGEEVYLGMSVGAAAGRTGDRAEALIRRADEAMYEAKKSKRVGALSLVLAG
ncbi:response regulator receiver modulated diguanylate cyclase/phosphodiesterase with PAS/PAC sensor(s) [Actinoplanes sp. SE50]|uniref:GGDEF domain-containing protein n=1 Tax=unclassified Actinoplanes TaxID=2626549 RepID=UPI00023EC839|nr:MULTISPECIES: GGDEF domain-containing protein [unclassified Actinoplanes]AEV86465.1 response regulator receiver modulated diguanylate cyclase/phosphodiesterase with PAS/PAC sensor(s) [Actinoplanes sp. SE50/110]ATO84863.1 response regulator receiver modulated diguanylate cyclase/phosphodiesterase with PAS/PAC sensor(s) [Actinoplanes sp. SE50]SLM02272.1 diguanylate cyclase [Actinoplanes sp. SE50/110]